MILSRSVTDLNRGLSLRRAKRPVQQRSDPPIFRFENILYRIPAAAFLGLFVLLTACSPPTYFFESIDSKDVRVRDDRILGLWVSIDPDEDFEEVGPVEVKTGRRGSYTIIAPGEYVLEDDNLYTFTGYLASLGGRTYIDLIQADVVYEKGGKMSDLPETLRMHTFPLRVVGRINLGDETTSLELLDPDWLEDYIKDHPGALEYEEGFVFSGTEVVQAFLAERGAEWKTRGDTWVFTRPEPEE